MPVQVFVVHWNRPDGCLDTIEHLLAQTVPVQITVVDNGSETGCIDRLRDRLPAAVELIELGRNTGFGPGANAGLRRWLRDGAAEWAAVVPHDALPERDALERLLAAARSRSRLGLLSADVGDGARPIVHPYLGTIDAPITVVDGFEESDYAHGTLLALRRACIEEIGVFDERYFAYCEEADLGLRARAAGWQVGIVRGALVTNPEMGSVVAVDYLKLRNTLLLVREHFGFWPWAFRFAVGVFQLADGTVRKWRQDELFSGRGRLLALRDDLRRCYGPPPSALAVRRPPDHRTDTSPRQSRPASTSSRPGRIRRR